MMGRSSSRPSLGALVICLEVIYDRFRPTPAVVKKPSASLLPASSEAEKNGEEKARNAVTVDAAQPVTNIQIRLQDGSRLVNRFNEAQAVADVRRYIQLTRPELFARLPDAGRVPVEAVVRRDGLIEGGQLTGCSY
ncbi:hypothetical protein BV898_11365 [Hypsibius exemplaris]|uniref:UBX domain-containing protein n=1 Tax=Hypsibius exemplaris TaxID=2072580 RepID=A0A1W0WGS2_HYPEX|nr:hypothetical protein BV898_11365 [Hypsibius exemplaris]